MTSPITVYSFILLVVISTVSSQFVINTKDSIEDVLDIKKSMLNRQNKLPASTFDGSVFGGATFRSKMNKIHKFVELGLQQSLEKYKHQETISPIDVIRFLLKLREELKYLSITDNSTVHS